MVVIPQSIPFHDENRNQTLSRDREKIMAPKNNRAELGRDSNNRIPRWHLRLQNRPNR
jgi:hypothetical protein